MIRGRIWRNNLLLVIKMIMKWMFTMIVLVKRRWPYDPPVKEVIARQKWTGCWVAVDALWRSEVAGMEPS